MYLLDKHSMKRIEFIMPPMFLEVGIKWQNKRQNLPGSIPSVFGALVTGAKMVTLEIVTFLQS